jgi:hypothetical protein
MSVFDVLGAAATILQFVEYGIKFGNKVIAIHKNRSDLAELHQLTREFQRTTKLSRKAFVFARPVQIQAKLFS